MKTASLPSLQVKPEVREAVESVLRRGESLSGLMGESLRDEAVLRRHQEDLIVRGLASREEARGTGAYFEADQVHYELRIMLDRAKARRHAFTQARITAAS